MKIADVYVPDVRTCSRLVPLPEAAKEMADAGIGALAVIDEANGLVGIISERDLVLALADEESPGSVSAGDYTTADVETARLDEEASDVARRMLDAEIRHLPVVENNQVVGMISMRDLLALETWV